jgi:hypothetical protein
MGSSIELSADGPLRAPYTVYMQGGLNFAAARAGVTAVASREFEERVRRARSALTQAPAAPEKEDDGDAPRTKGTKKKGPSHRASKRERLRQRGMEKL